MILVPVSSLQVALKGRSDLSILCTPIGRVAALRFAMTFIKKQPTPSC